MGYSWGVRQEIQRVGPIRFKAWCEVRKRSDWSRDLTPTKCERAAKRGDAKAQEVMNKLTVITAKARLLGAKNV